MVKRWVGAGLAVLLGVQCYGCALLLGAAAGGIGTAFWLSGKLSDKVVASYESTLNATKGALASMDMPITKETKTAEITQIKSQYSDEREVWIDVMPMHDDLTKIEIRVGAKGDKEASQKILDAVKKHL